MLLRWYEHSLVYYPSREMEDDKSKPRPPFENVFFPSRDGVQLNAWFFEANKNSPREPKVVLISHGNGGNISHRMDLYRVLLDLGLNVFAFDYRGYGQSRGKPGEEGTYLDAQAAHGWLRQKGFAGKNIIAYGESLGGGVASELAMREEVGALVLQSTFTSIPEIGAELYPWLPVRLISTIQYNTRRKLPQLRVPVLVLHSREDRLVRYHHAQENFAAANEPKFFAELRGDHNELVWIQPEFHEAMEKFINFLESRR